MHVFKKALVLKTDQWMKDKATKYKIILYFQNKIYLGF